MTEQLNKQGQTNSPGTDREFGVQSTVVVEERPLADLRRLVSILFLSRAAAARWHQSSTQEDRFPAFSVKHTKYSYNSH